MTGSTGGVPSGEPARDDVERRRDALLAEALRNAEDAGKPPAERSGNTQALAGLGLQFVIVILICLYAGMWLDRKLGTGPWLLVVGVIVGASAGFFVMFRVLAAENAKSAGKSRK